MGRTEGAITCSTLADTTCKNKGLTVLFPARDLEGKIVLSIIFDGCRHGFILACGKLGYWLRR